MSEIILKTDIFKTSSKEEKNTQKLIGKCELMSEIILKTAIFKISSKEEKSAQKLIGKCELMSENIKSGHF